MIGARSRPSRRSMLWIVTSRIIAIAVVVVLLQLAQVANDYYFDEAELAKNFIEREAATLCLLYTSPSPRDRQKSRMPSSA